MTAPLCVAVDVSAVPNEPVGAGIYTIELTRALDATGEVDLRLLARRGDRARWAAIAPSAEVLAEAPDDRVRRLWWGARRLGDLAGASQESSVLLAPHYTMPARCPLPVVVTVHDLTVVDHPEWHERSKVLFFRRALRLAARRATALICVSRQTAERFTATYRPAGPVSVVPHGVDHRRFTPEEPSPNADATARHRLGVEGRYLLHLGTIEPRKDVPSLVSAFDRLAADDSGLRLVLAGQPAWGTAGLERALAASPHRAAVQRLGYVPAETVPALLRGAAAVAYPALEEGFGLPVLEALACGAPVVTTAGSVMAELAGEAALLAPRGDPDGLAAALRHALAGGEERAARRALGLERAAAHTWAASAAAHLDVLRAAAGGR